MTSAGAPLFPGNWLAAGQHLNVAGSNYPGRREVDGKTVARADLIVADDVSAARLEAGDLLLAEQDVALAATVVDRATAAGVGQTVDI